MRQILGLSAALLVAACTPMEWVRPGTPFQQMQADSADCDALAWRESYRLSLWDPWYGWSGHPIHGRRYPFHRDPMMSRMQRERDLRDFCMRARGYQLVPVG